MSKRVTTQELAEKLDRLTDVIGALVNNVAENQTPAAAPEEPEAETPKIKVSEAYLQHQTEAAQKYANKRETDYVLYARKNKLGETKLAFATADRYASLRDSGLIGPVAYISPTK